MKFVTNRYRLIIVVLLIGLTGFIATRFLHRSDILPGNIRNVILISIDTCRADHLSCYGYESNTTPNIDAVAAEGMLFEQAISPVPLTLPAHSSLLTGTIPPYHGVHDNFDYLDKSNITLAEILKEAGFTTAAVVSAFVLDSQFGIEQGFETHHDRFESPLEGNDVEQRQGGETTRVAIDWLEENKGNEFFLFLHYYDPHAQYQPPEPFASRFASNPYAGEIAYVDHCLGQIIQKLKDLALYDSTLLIITADHGEMLGEHGEPTHDYFVYQSAVKVPLIFKIPGCNKPARIKPIVGLVDIVPTVCSLLKIETPKHVQGVDLAPIFKGDCLSVQDRHVYCESFTATKYHANSLLAIVSDRYKYIQTTRPELYDLVEDAAESNNLVEQRGPQATMMKNSLAEMLEQSVRNDSPESAGEMDARAISRLQSLGYVGGAVTEDFSFDETKDDPKDLLAYHLSQAKFNTYFMKKEYAKAKICAEKMIVQRPDCSVGYEQLGKTVVAQKDYSQAVVYLHKVIEMEPDRSEAYDNRGLAYLSKGDYDQAIGDFDKAIELEPTKVGHYNNRGRAYWNKGDHEQAIRDFNIAVELDPDNALFHNNRGLAFWGKRDFEQALQDFDKAIELNPRDAKTHYNRGRAYWIKDDYEQALRDFNRAIELNPRYAKAYNNRGSTYSSQGDSQRAIDDFAAAIKLDRTSAEAHQNMSLELLRQGKAQEAIEYGREAVRLQADWPEGLNDLAWMLATTEDSQLRDGAEAVRLAEQACQLTNYKKVTILDTLAAAYAEVGQFDKAVQMAETAIQLALAAGKDALVDDIRSRQDLYKAERPYHELFSS
jgi:arylsulfatase A-like enzyme/Flp pilus assembly protein TadD